MSEVRFIADSMLGSLARWLRILGFDTLYFRDIKDNDLIRIARQQQRIIITRDTGLLRNRRIDSLIHIKSNDLRQQLDEFLVWVKGRGIRSQPYTICPLCNGEILPVDKLTIRNDVPEFVFLNLKSFYKCRECGKVYWEGSHKKGIDEIIDLVGSDRTV
jgi:uncharacterized protein with PIN domain